jgi:hypothetical protein
MQDHLSEELPTTFIQQHALGREPLVRQERQGRLDGREPEPYDNDALTLIDSSGHPDFNPNDFRVQHGLQPASQLPDQNPAE